MKEFQVSKFLDISSDYLFKYLEKLNDFSSKPKGQKIVKGIVKIVLMLFLLLLTKIIFLGISSIGTGLIYVFGTTLRGMLSGIWENTVMYSFYVFALINIYRLLSGMAKDKKYAFDIKINKKKCNIYELAAKITKIIVVVLCVPILSIVFTCCAAIGILLSFLQHGIALFSLFLMIISIIIILCSSLIVILELVLVKERGKNA